ncbi:uncharacterized protein LOC116767093 [Danaus plexippus]|uniref:uncharacterized protein LOC116767093 n=1 Tax=Danaus plexippus TaxID=13037 RepID=UPI002AB0877A|nr:uncharacterized protein LOC116767093 [Danaus plexippus]
MNSYYIFTYTRDMMDDRRCVKIYPIFLIMLITIALSRIVESKSANKEEALGSKHIEQVNRFKRGATNIINSVEGLVTGILDSTWGHIARVKKIPKEENVIYGGGNNNENTFVLDYEYDYQ